MLRILIIIALLLIAVPLFNSTKDYVTDKTEKTAMVGKAIVNVIKQH